LIAINSGANMNFDRLRYVAERADIGAQREALLAVEIPSAGIVPALLRTARQAQRDRIQLPLRRSRARAFCSSGWALTQGRPSAGACSSSHRRGRLHGARHDRQ
jgi:hypothetical protein